MLYDGSLRLHRRQISAEKFLLACVFPLPYLLYASVVYLKKALKRPLFFQELKSKSSIVDLKEDRETSLQCSLEASILEVLSAPFSKQTQDDQTPGKVYWESILIGRRFILILIGWFMTQTFLILIAMTTNVSKETVSARLARCFAKGFVWRWCKRKISPSEISIILI